MSTIETITTIQTFNSQFPNLIHDFGYIPESAEDSVDFLLYGVIPLIEKNNWKLLRQIVNSLNLANFLFPEFGLPLWAALFVGSQWDPTVNEKDFKNFILYLVQKFCPMDRDVSFNNIMRYIRKNIDSTDKTEKWIATLTKVGESLQLNEVQVWKCRDFIPRLFQLHHNNWAPPLSIFWVDFLEYWDKNYDVYTDEEQIDIDDFICCQSFMSTSEQLDELKFYFDESLVDKFFNFDMNMLDANELMSVYLQSVNPAKHDIDELSEKILKKKNFDWMSLIDLAFDNHFDYYFDFGDDDTFQFENVLFDAFGTTMKKYAGKGEKQKRREFVLELFDVDIGSDDMEQYLISTKKRLENFGGDWAELFQEQVDEYKKRKIMTQYGGTLELLDPVNIDSEELKKLITFHEIICHEKAEEELRGISQSWKIRTLFPNVDTSTMKDQRYVTTFGDLCKLLQAAIFCNDLRNSEFSLSEIKKIGILLYPDQRKNFEKSNTKKDVCKMMAKAMDVTVQIDEKIKKESDLRTEHCVNDADYVTQEKWSDLAEELDDDVLITINFAEKSFCFTLSSILNSWKYAPKINILANWIQNPEATLMDEEGYGGMPGNERYYKLPNGFFINHEGYEILSNLGKTEENVQFRATPFKTNERYGNVAGLFGISNVHGGQYATIYSLKNLCEKAACLK